jgi:hypothetical protein
MDGDLLVCSHQDDLGEGGKTEKMVGIIVDMPYGVALQRTRLPAVVHKFRLLLLRCGSCLTAGGSHSLLLFPKERKVEMSVIAIKLTNFPRVLLFCISHSFYCWYRINNTNAQSRNIFVIFLLSTHNVVTCISDYSWCSDWYLDLLTTYRS